MATGLILGIESSCDETSAAIVRGGREVLSNLVASQMIHGNYGGVVPELASREHLRNIVPVVREAMERAGVGYAELNAIAVTEGPGLAGALLVGITFAKALALGTSLPLIGVNHLEGHIHAVLMEAEASFADRTPLLALVVSGGHTHLYLATKTPEQTWRYRNVGKTLDDAAGEAYDKVAKLLGLPYPGGPWMDALAVHGDPNAVPFTMAQLKNKGRLAPKLVRDFAEPDDLPRFDFSFSGLKTAVLRYVQAHEMRAGAEARAAALASSGLAHGKPSDPATLAAALQGIDPLTLNLIASFQNAVVSNLVRNTFAAVEAYGAQAVLISGGVAANRDLRARMTAFARQRSLPIAFPQIALSTDNAAMIAAAAWPKWLSGSFADDALEPTPQLRLG